MTKLLGNYSRKCNTKLRLIANCSTEVNTLKSEQCAAMRVEPVAMPLALAEQDISAIAEQYKALQNEQTVLSMAASIPLAAGAPAEVPVVARPKLSKLASGVTVNVFVETQETGRSLPKSLRGYAHRANLVATTVALADLPTLLEHRNVLSVELGTPIASPTPHVAAAGNLVPAINRWNWHQTEGPIEAGKVLIGIIDVQGFDFAHPDFMNEHGTRFVRIWDQGGAARPSPHQQDDNRYASSLNFGAEFRKEHLDAAIAAAPQLRLPPQEIERQSQMATSSHGTHVASIAAGNQGVCPQALLAGVLISLPQEADPLVERRQSFYDSTRIALAVDYLMALGDELGVPVSINISLGTNGHAHDGTGAISRWLDAAVIRPGRSICVATGNAGQEVATSPSDPGFVMGRIHTSGQVKGRFQQQEIDWTVVGNLKEDISENELEIWYSEQDRFAVSVLPPLPDSHWIGPIEPLEFIENIPLANGSLLSIYNELYHPANGNNHIAVYLTPFLTQTNVTGIPAGDWKVRLHGRDVRDGRYHGWIERDDPRRVGRVGAKEFWRFPSYFAETSNVDDSSVSSLACGRRVISVANLHEAEERVNITSSQGPTRDNRQKPDVAAPGTDMLAANGFAAANAPWIKMSGTSMASPFVAGVVGLMLTVEPTLTAAQIEGILHRTSRPLPGRTFSWANDAGFGRIDPKACIAEARTINKVRNEKILNDSVLA